MLLQISIYNVFLYFTEKKIVNFFILGLFNMISF